MWRMLCARGKDLPSSRASIEADDGARPRALERDATRIGRRGGRVDNDIDATFAFRDGRIVGHVDRFDLWRWATQALGLSGRVLGFTPLLAPLVRKQAASALAAWRRREREA